jgi:hypothetical protein
MSAESRPYETMPFVRVEGRRRWQGMVVDPSGLQSGVGHHPDPLAIKDLSVGLEGRLPPFIVTAEAAAESHPSEGPDEFPTEMENPPPSEAGSNLIPFLVRRHRATIGPHGETVWEPAFPPVTLVPLVPPSEGWEAVERYLLPSLPGNDEDLLMVASPSGGYAGSPKGRGAEQHRSREAGVPGRRDAAVRLASALRHRLPARRMQPSA